jgi:hypothetical protein
MVAYALNSALPILHHLQFIGAIEEPRQNAWNKKLRIPHCKVITYMEVVRSDCQQHRFAEPCVFQHYDSRFALPQPKNRIWFQNCRIQGAPSSWPACAVAGSTLTGMPSRNEVAEIFSTASSGANRLTFAPPPEFAFRQPPL